MFKNLTNFAHKRNGWEVLGFYLAYLLLIIVVALLLGAAVALLDFDTEVAFRLGNAFAIIICLVLSFMVLKQKKLTGNFGLILVALLSGVLAFIGGGILGLIPVAFLTTRG